MSPTVCSVVDNIAMQETASLRKCARVSSAVISNHTSLELDMECKTQETQTQVQNVTGKYSPIVWDDGRAEMYMANLCNFNYRKRKHCR